MARKLQEYRPWKSKEQFEKEIGKYVDAKEVARLWRFVVIEYTPAAVRPDSRAQVPKYV